MFFFFFFSLLGSEKKKLREGEEIKGTQMGNSPSKDERLVGDGNKKELIIIKRIIMRGHVKI